MIQTFLLLVGLSLWNMATEGEERGILGQQAPDWNIASWIDAEGEPTQISKSDYEGKVIYLMCFQSWCPGCHSSGFPTLQKVIKAYADNDQVAFLSVQTVFEGHGTNTESKVRQTQQRYKLDIPMGHDPGIPHKKYPNIMENYRTGGTPWVIIIAPDGKVAYNDFHIEPEKAIKLINRLLPG